MRVLLLSHGLPPESVGGVQQHVVGLASALVAQGHDVHLFARATLPGVEQGERTATAPGNPAVTFCAFRWQGVDSLDAMYECRPMAAALRAFLADRKAAGEAFDIAHVHHLTGLSTDAVAVLRAAGVPVVLTLHDYWLFCPRGQMFHKREEVCATASPQRCGECLQATFPWWLGEHDREQRVTAIHDRARTVLETASRLIVPSARALPPFEALGIDRGRFTVVENGVDTEALTALPPAAPHDGPLRLGYLGTLMASKGLHVAIDALQQLPPGTATLRVHGNAVPYHGDESYLNRCCQRLRAGDGVSYHGPYGTDELPRLLADIDVLLAPALWHEAFGLTVREALAASRPVLVSRVGGLQDSVQDGEQGFVLEPGDVAAWAAAIGRLAADRGLVRTMAQKARTRARSFADMARQLVEIYRQA
ncbi:MAG: glycosyltransferase family 4 protein [Planctomycetes bacterium]|nr:glycosyltransferase family 4 protein [Planctomycetota bacterium]